MKKSDYVTLPYDSLNEKGLDKLKSAIGKGGYEIAKVVPAGAARKKDGIPTRTFSLVGMDEQVMSLQVNNTGDISGIKLNGKTIPYRHDKSMADLGRTLADMFNRGATAFQKQMAKKMARAAGKDDQAKSDKPAIKSNAQKLSDAKAMRDSLREDIAQATSKSENIQSNLDRVAKESESLKNQLNSELATTRELKEQIAKLEEMA